VRTFRLEKCGIVQSMASIIGQFCFAFLVDSGAGSLALAYPLQQVETQSPPKISDTNSIPEWFATANRWFLAGNFREARTEYEKVSSRCPGTELSVQCEYFAAIAAWNVEPNEVSAKLIETWLQKAKAFEQKTKQNNTPIVSPSWPHWIQSAQVVLSNWESSQNRFESAKNYLNLAMEESTKSGFGASRVHYELGKLFANHFQDPEAAQAHLDKAMESVGSDQQLKTDILLASARTSIERDDLEIASECLQNLTRNELSSEQRVIAAILEYRIQTQPSAPSVTTATFWDEALAAIKQGPIKIEVLEDLASTLQEAGQLKQTTQVLEEIVRSHPNHPGAVPARVQLAYQAANQKDWELVAQLTLTAIEKGGVDQWTTYAIYLNGRSKMELGQGNEGISLLNSLLADSNLTNDLRTNIHLDLAQAHYLAEEWDMMEPHVEILSQMDQPPSQPSNINPRVRMWKAELLAHKGEWESAESIVSAIRKDFPKWNRRTEVDYLLARCLIARAEFDSARSILHAIKKPEEAGVGTKQAHSSVLAARAAWMIGETFMMQQRYEEASQAYGDVLQFPNESFWCAASIVQKGLCAEQLNRFQEAKEHYEQVIAEYSQSPFAQTARTRLSGISLSTKQVDRIGSGTKR
jgi:tetratricopeptide (TPR) repeat protein